MAACSAPRPNLIYLPCRTSLQSPEQVAMGMIRKSASHPMDAQLTQLLQASTVS